MLFFGLPIKLKNIIILSARIFAGKLSYFFRLSPPLPVNVVLVTSYKCNSGCATCNIHRRPDAAGEKELSVEEYEKIFSNMGKLNWVTVGGGEPFLREDFADIIISLYRLSKPDVINVPSNGSCYVRMKEQLLKITYNCEDIKLVINLSLDALGERHDRIRGRRGSFEEVKKSVEVLKEFKERGISCGIHTVISNENIDDINDIMEYVRDELKPDTHIFEQVQNRREFLNRDEKYPLDSKKLKDVYKTLIKEQHAADSFFTRAVLSFRRLYYIYSMRFIENMSMPYSCYSGIASCQINPQGELWACAVNDFLLGDLRQEQYDFKKIWHSKNASAARKKIKTVRCSCILANAAYTNMLMDTKSMLLVIIRLCLYRIKR